MLWKNRRGSSNLIDRRGVSGPISIGGLILGAVIYYFMGGNPADYVAQNSGSMQKQEVSSAQDNLKEFIAVVLADTEDVWNQVFKANNLEYQEPKLIVFNQIVQSACGRASRASGPFYCPEDHQIYLDLSFFNQLSNSLGAEGDFAVAYVIAHEVGHHIQNQWGLLKNGSSVDVELQADCLAGVWAKKTAETKNVIEEGDIEEALGAASAVGDDRLQKASGREVVPDSFTHGSSQQRVSAFKAGYRNGNPQACITIN